VVRETNTTSGDITDYLYGDDLIKQTIAANDSYFLYDGLGSTRALSNNIGLISDTYDYTSFGKALNQTGATENNYLFTGEQYDSNLDNYYLRARYYDQSIGRFTQQDTWMGDDDDPITLHKYLYANVNPVNMIDPSGQFSSFIQAAAATTIVGILATTAQQSSLIGQSLVQSNSYDSGIKVSLAKESLALMAIVRYSIWDIILLAENTKSTKNKIASLMREADEHAGKINSSPPEDPDQNHWKGEVKAFLERAKRLADKRLKGKSRESTIKAIEDIAKRAGVELK
jgi:RHS repeat-associated protein